MRFVVVVNETSRRGVHALRSLERRLPGAEVVSTGSLAEVDALARELVARPPDLVLGAGGDGTALALVNAAFRARRERGVAGPLLRLGLLKLGTGNGWANSLGAPGVDESFAQLAEVARTSSHAPLPLARFDLLEVEGTLAHFAGTGWDAELIDDFHAQKTDASVLPARARRGLVGYLNGLLTRSVPRNLKLPRVEIEVSNTGSTALGIDRQGRPYALPDATAGAVLYRGPASVCGAGTSTQWGFGFRAFPFARLVPGRFNFRMYAAPTAEALVNVPLLWAGRHPFPKMHTWMLDRAKVRFSRPVPFQAGGDLLGHRDEIDYVLSGETVEVLDWRALARGLGAKHRLAIDAVLSTARPLLSAQGFMGR